MDFHKAFQEIDEDDSGEITNDELVRYMKRMNYTEAFVDKWLNLFDINHDGSISYEEYCTTLGMIPKKEVVEQARRVSTAAQAANAAGSGKGGIVPKKVTPVHAAGPSVRATGGKDGAASKKTIKLPKNYEISPGVMRYSKARMIGKKALYRHAKHGHNEKIKSTVEKTTETETKTIGGEKNGDTREVVKTNRPRSFPTQNRKKQMLLRRRIPFSEHKRRLRPSLVPGAVLILLVGRHRGKRVVFLRQLKTGLLLVTGPFKLNGCPLRRVNQRFVIATKTQLDVNDLELPRRINDAYFRRAPKSLRHQKATGAADLFAKSKIEYAVSTERKEDQKSVDRQIGELIKKRSDSKLFTSYLSSQFSLSKKDYPHKMVF